MFGVLRNVMEAKKFFFFFIRILNISVKSDLAESVYIRILSFEFEEFERYCLNEFGFQLYLYDDRVEFYRDTDVLLGIFDF